MTSLWYTNEYPGDAEQKRAGKLDVFHQRSVAGEEIQYHDYGDNDQSVAQQLDEQRYVFNGTYHYNYAEHD